MKTIRIGRGHDNDIVVEDISVSIYHCQLTQYDDGRVVICDCGSSNGTFVNGQRIREKTQLNWSDFVRVGNIAFQWTSCVQAPGYQEPPMTSIPREKTQADSSTRKREEDNVDYHIVNDVNYNYNEGGFGRQFGQSAGKGAGVTVGCFIGVIIVIIIIVAALASAI